MMAETKNTKSFYNTEIPSDWEVLRLENACSHFKSGFGITSDKIAEEGIYPVYGGNGLRGFTDTFTHEGDFLLIGRQGALCGNIQRISDKVYISEHAIAVQTNEQNDLDYLAYKLEYKNLNRLSESSAQPGLAVEKLLRLKVEFPPLPEQKAIAQVLSTADAAIHTTEKLITQKELRKKWLMQQLLTGKKRLKGFSGEWKEHSYEKILKVVKRNFDWDENELYKLISVRRRSGGIFFREALYGHQILVKTLRTANEGDFLFSKMQILHGASALVTKEFDGAKISGSYIAVVPKEKKQLNMEFFQWYSQTPYFYHQTYISSYGVHIEKMTFDFDTFLQLEMKLPSIEEQTAIAQVLQAADKEISLLKAKAEKLREQKKGLMQVLLTGKVRLKINE
ncbi:restriction endonuclease subunit S [Agriterribacter humi]|uniref:restriction endonuclease subunit S n=1 Tax=Agriterribacter humi TaxID=1104781 RepID=UPI001264057B|nr:restriction endonuclease subunit S [Agriterribacter humi]